MTLPLVGASNSFMNGTLTRLKKYRSPIQVMPARKWIQRSSMRNVALASGRAMLGANITIWYGLGTGSSGDIENALPAHGLYNRLAKGPVAWVN